MDIMVTMGELLKLIYNHILMEKIPLEELEEV